LTGVDRLGRVGSNLTKVIMPAALDQAAGLKEKVVIRNYAAPSVPEDEKEKLKLQAALGHCYNDIGRQ